MDLVPLKIHIGLKNGRMHDYPVFNTLPARVRGSMDWAHFVDQYGGMHYDQLCGHDDDEPDSPCGCWLGMVMIPSDFAEAAVEKWPDRCTVLTESQARDFYDCRCHARDPEVIEDAPVLQSIAAKRSLGMDDDPHDADALNVDHPAFGRRRNKNKKFDDFLKSRRIRVIGLSRKRRRKATSGSR